MTSPPSRGQTESMSPPLESARLRKKVERKTERQSAFLLFHWDANAGDHGCCVKSLTGLQLPSCGEAQGMWRNHMWELGEGTSGNSSLLLSSHPHESKASQQRSHTSQRRDNAAACLVTDFQTRSIHEHYLILFSATTFVMVCYLAKMTRIPGLTQTSGLP